MVQINYLFVLELDYRIGGVSTPDSAVNRTSPCTRVGPMGHESHAGPRSRTTHAPALTPDLTLSTECRFIIGHKLRRKNLGEFDTLPALGFAFYWESDFLFRARAALLDATRNSHRPFFFLFGVVYDCCEDRSLAGKRS